MRRVQVLIVACLAFAGARVKADSFVFTPPSADRWHYGFNSSPGTRQIGSCFMAPGWAGINGEFNDRDGYVILVFDTSNVLLPGGDPASYNVTSIGLVVTNAPGAEWLADDTPDEWYTYDLNGDGTINADGFPRGHASDTDGESDDPDPGRTIEIYGVGFGPTFTYESWTELSFYVGALYSGPPYFGDPVAARDPFPFTYQEGTLEKLHIEDHVRGLHNDELAIPVFEFMPQPWSIGVPQNYTPGSQAAAFDIHFSVDLALSNGAVKQYFQEQLAGGKVYVIVSSAQESSQLAGQEGYPSLYMREAVGVVPGAKAAALSIEISSLPGDHDGDGDVDATDFIAFPPCLTGPGAINATPACDVFDFDEDQDIDLRDFGAFQFAIGG